MRLPPGRSQANGKPSGGSRPSTSTRRGPKRINSVNRTGTVGSVAIINSGADVTYKPPLGYCNDPGGTPDKFTYTLDGGSTAAVVARVSCPPGLDSGWPTPSSASSWSP